MFVLNNISKSFGDKTLFKKVNLNIYDGERIGIVGVNGSGKSTFIKILIGEMEADEGVVQKSGTFAYVKQIAEKSKIESCKQEEFLKFVKQNNELNLHNDIKQDFETLSGGEQVKFMISYELSKNVDGIVLDEPTNNLDQESVDWLIDRLNKFKGTIIVVSHDRYFLDKVVDKILEFENGEIKEFYGGYSDYEEQKLDQMNYANKVYQERVVENKKLQNQIQRLSQLTDKLERATKRDGSADKRAKGFKDSAQNKVKKVAKQAEAKKNRLEKLKNELGPAPYKNKEIFYRVESEEIKNKMLVKFDKVSKNFGEKLLFADVNLTIENGEKVALIGKNGSGKTTFIKMILGEEDFKGNIWKSQNLKIAYLSQKGFDMQSEKSIFEFANEFNEYKTQFLTNLCNLGFVREMFNKKISHLSSGEKMKIKLNELIVGNFNFLILDEPTNNLDIQNKKFLEQVLEKYKGNLLIVSHDRTFVDRICNKKIFFKDKKLYKE